jgi:multicomponent Na+:H+ antiporter subunit B
MRRRKIIALLLGVVFILTWSSGRLDNRTEPYDVAAYYVDHAYMETGSTNVVTAIYLNYRYYDTLFEALMLLFSIIGVIFMSVHEGGEHDE